MSIGPVVEYESPRARVNARSDLVTLVAIATAAHAAADVVHEVLGHVGMCLLTGIKFSWISTVGITTAEASRVVAAAGVLMNIVTGALALLAFRRRRVFDATTYFLWLFGAISMMEFGYLIFSGITGIGDWARVIGGLKPQIAWRIGMIAIGYIGYVLTMKLCARLIAPHVSQGELRRMTTLAYLTGGILLPLASLFNPQGAQFIWISGVGASLGMMIGLLRIPSMARSFNAKTSGETCLGRSIGWTVAGAVIAVGFIAILGPGIRIR